MKADIGALMKQAQKMQSEMQKAQDELEDLEITGEAGGGLVRLTMTGKHEVRALSIDDSLVGEDRDMLEDIVIAAFNDAMRKVDETVKQKMSGLGAGLGLPPGLKLPF